MAYKRKNKGRLLNKILMGSEKSEGYARASLPSNRFELFWDILKGRFGKLVIVNLLICLFLIPLFAIFFFKVGLTEGLGSTYPYNQVFGVGYGAPMSMKGFAESITFSVNSLVYLFLPIALVIASIGIAGGAYIMRNIVWTEGIFVSNDFWHGIKVNFMQMCIVAVIYSIVFYASQYGISFIRTLLEINDSSKWLIVLEIIIYIFLIVYSMMTMHMITMLVTYKLSFKQLFKNSIYLTFGAFPASLAFFILGAIPIVLCFFGGIVMLIGIIVLVLFGISYFLLVWTDFSQWLYDDVINPTIGAKVNRGIYTKVKKEETEKESYSSPSSYGSRPIKPIDDDDIVIAELPESFNREDINRLMASKQAMYDDTKKYIELHQNDPEFIKMKEDAEKQKEKDEERLKRIAKAKKELEKHNKNKK